MDLDIKCPIFGQLEEFSEDQLPDQASVLKELIFIRKFRRNPTLNRNEKEQNKKKVFTKIKAIWAETSIPLVTDRRILAMIDKLVLEYDNVYKKYSYPHEKMINAFVEFREELEGKQSNIIPMDNIKVK